MLIHSLTVETPDYGTPVTTLHMSMDSVLDCLLANYDDESGAMTREDVLDVLTSTGYCVYIEEHDVRHPRTWPETEWERSEFADWQLEVANSETVTGFRDWLMARGGAG